MGQEIRQYLLTVTAAALICAIVNTLTGPQGTVKAVIKLLSGLFLAASVISPWVQIGPLDFSDFSDAFHSEAADAVFAGESAALDGMAEIIKQRTAAYILDKAESLELDIEVEVTLDSSNPPQPCAVTLTGGASPYAKEILRVYIEENLGIAKENQLWS